MLLLKIFHKGAWGEPVPIIKTQKSRQKEPCHHNTTCYVLIFYNVLIRKLTKLQLRNENLNPFALNSKQRWSRKGARVLRQATQRKPSAKKKTIFVCSCLFGPDSGNGYMPKFLLQSSVQYA